MTVSIRLMMTAINSICDSLHVNFHPTISRDEIFKRVVAQVKIKLEITEGSDDDTNGFVESCVRGWIVTRDMRASTDVIHETTWKLWNDFGSSMRGGNKFHPVLSTAYIPSHPDNLDIYEQQVQQWLQMKKDIQTAEVQLEQIAYALNYHKKVFNQYPIGHIMDCISEYDLKLYHELMPQTGLDFSARDM